MGVFALKSTSVSSSKLSGSTCLAMSSQPLLQEEESSEEVTVKEVIVREPFNFFSEFSLAIVLVTLIVQSAYVPTLKVF